MKNIFLPQILVLAVSFIIISWPATVHAQAPDQNKGRAIEGLYFRSGDEISLSKTINGDVYIAGGMVTIEGKINGDLLVAGGVVAIRGKISDDLRVGGGFVNIEGEIGKNVLVIGGNIIISPTAKIKGSLLAIGGNLSIAGTIGKEAQLYGENITLSGSFGGKTKATATKLKINPGARLESDLRYIATTKATIAKEASISGKVERLESPVVRKPQKPRFALGLAIFTYLSSLLIGLVIVKLAPRQIKALSELIEKQPWKNLGLGFLLLLSVPIAIILLMISIIGLPLALLTLAFYIIAIGVSHLVTGFWVGKRLLAVSKFKKNLYLRIALGLLLLQLIFALPLVGTFAKLVSILLALGAQVTLGQEAIKRLGAKRR